MITVFDATTQQIKNYCLANELLKEGNAWRAALVLQPYDHEGRFDPNPYSMEQNTRLEFYSILRAAQIWTKIADTVIPEGKQECLDRAEKCFNAALVFYRAQQTNNIIY
ncbi:MAG: hypothetical protein JSR58_04120 [Verrucomicrobia bacterium]|nr:hypothetical protein [Verrucomicrobiota bacterium]